MTGVRYRGVTLRGVQFGADSRGNGPGVLGGETVARKHRDCDGCGLPIRPGDRQVHVNAFNQIYLCLTCGDRTRMNEEG